MSRVPAAHLAPQLRALMDAGHTTAAIEAVTGVSRATILNILSGRVRAVQPATAAELAKATPAALLRHTPSTNIPALGTTRRVQALRVVGWTNLDIAAGTGLSKSAVSHLAHGHHTVVHRDVAWAVASWYADHWRVRSLSGLTSRQRAAAVNGRRDAARRGWAPGAAWDDIDDLDATPDTGAPDDPRGSNRRTIHVEDIEWVLRYERHTWASLEHRLDTDRDTLYQALRRHGKRELLARLREESEAA